jgi:hypothetical protein
MPKGIGRREDLVGIKINVNTLIENNKTIKDIKTLFERYIDSDEYTIGLDETLCKEPHYHLHFRTQVKFNTISDFKSKNFKNQPTTKLYCAKNYQESQDEVWFAYPLKENIIEIGEKLKRDQLEPLAKAQREIKKLKHVFSEKEKDKKEARQESIELVFAYLDQNWFTIREQYSIPDDHKYKISYLGQINYYIENKQSIPPKFQLERQARNYLMISKKWTAVQLFAFDNPSFN